MSYKKFFDTINSYYNSINDDIQEKVKDLSNKNNYEYVFSKNDDIQLIEVYLDNKFILKAEYCVLGLYNIQLSMWYWSWNIAFINKKLIELPVKKIKNFISIIDDNYDKFDKVDVESLHYLISNDNFYISNSNIDKIIKLSLYLTKSIWYFPIKQNDNDESNQLQYILITKILQY